MSIATLVAATRPAFLSVTLVGVLLGFCTAATDGAFRSSLLAAATLLFALLAHAGANVINDYYDALSGCDAANTERIAPFTGGSRFIQDGQLSEKQTAWLGYALLATVIPAGIALVLVSGPGLWLIGLIGLLAAWAYSARPLQLQSRGLGEVTITTAWLMVVMGSDYVQRGTLALAPLIAGTSYALLVANVLFINQIPDRAADAIAGKRTLIVRFGPGFAALGSALLYLLAALSISIGIITGYLPGTALILWLIALPAAYTFQQLRAAPTDRATLNRLIPLTISSTLLFGLTLCAVLVLT
jgi:1,4-dihydroxy-2-naphthoate octaprenyltransferase